MNLKFSLNEVITALLDNNESAQKDNHTGFFDSILTAQQPEKIQLPIHSTLSGIITFFIFQQPSKACLPNTLQLSGIIRVDGIL